MKGWVLLSALSLALVGCGSDEATSSAPRVMKDYTLREPVDITFDDQDIPHIYAQSDLDAVFAEGYQEATDDLYPLELIKRASTGHLAEVVGQQALQSDEQALTFRFAEMGRRSAGLLAQERPGDYNLLVAYAAGINRRIAEVDRGEVAKPDGFATLGFDPEPWTVDDVYAIGERIQFGFSNTFSFDLLATLLGKLVDHADQLPVYEPFGSAFYVKDAAAAGKSTQSARSAPLPAGRVAIDAKQASALFAALGRVRRFHGDGEGSNSWAVSGQHTDNGRPYLANDSHGPLTDPNLMHLQHLDSTSGGGTLDVIGLSYLGLPLVHVGHNQSIAWGATTNFADTMDLWDVSVDGDTVDLGGEQLAIETTTETIRVRAADGSVQDQDFDVRVVPGRGVLLPAAILPVPKALLANGELLLGWPGFEPTAELSMFAGFDRAKSLDDFDDAVGIQQIGMQNWIAASANGIRLRVHGLVPDRGPVATRPHANAILDGSDPSTLWSGAYLPDAHLPRLDGSQPFIVTANNDPWGHTADNDPTNDAFYYGSFYAPGFRAERITNRLGELIQAGSVTRDAMQSLQTEIRSTLAVEILPLLDDAMAAVDTDPDLAAYVGRSDLVDAVARLDAWDRRMDRASTEAALCRVFLAYLSKRTLAGPMGLLFHGIDDAQPVTMQKIDLLVHEQHLDTFLGGKQRVDLVGALSDAIAELDKRSLALGRPATWGDLHEAVFKKSDLTDPTILVTDGDDSTLNVAQSRCWNNDALAEHCTTTGGAVYRLVNGFDADGTPVATYDFPMGNAGSTDDWANERYAPLRFRRSDVEGHASATHRLTP